MIVRDKENFYQSNVLWNTFMVSYMAVAQVLSNARVDVISGVAECPEGIIYSLGELQLSKEDFWCS